MLMTLLNVPTVSVNEALHFSTVTIHKYNYTKFVMILMNQESRPFLPP